MSTVREELQTAHEAIERAMKAFNIKSTPCDSCGHRHYDHWNQFQAYTQLSTVLNKIHKWRTDAVIGVLPLDERAAYMITKIDPKRVPKPVVPHLNSWASDYVGFTITAGTTYHVEVWFIDPYLEDGNMQFGTIVYEDGEEIDLSVLPETARDEILLELIHLYS